MAKKYRTNKIQAYVDEATLLKFKKLCELNDRSESHQAATIIYQAVKDVKL